MAELRIGCLVMAAGSGSRFGRNKLEAVVDGKVCCAVRWRRCRRRNSHR